MRMGGEFIPQLEEGDFAVETRLLVGTNLNTTIQTFDKISKVLKDEFEEVEQVVSRIGAAEIPTDPMPIESGDMIIVLKPKKQWKNAKTYEELATKMKAAINARFVGVTMGFQYPVQMRFNELMTGSKQDVVIKVYGEDLNKLTQYSEQIGAMIPRIKGTADLYIEKMVGMPQVSIQYNRAEMARYGLTVQEVNTIVNSAFAGGVAGKIYEGEKNFDLVVRLDNTLRNQTEILENLFITTPNGIQVPLYSIAQIKYETGPNQIQREDTRRRITVGFNVRGRDVESIVNELQRKIDKNITFESGYTYSVGGTFQNLQEAKSRLVIAVPVALFLIFVLLYAAFKNIPDGLLIFTAIPLSSIGGVMALTLRGMPFSISAGIGFIALFGVAVLNGIVLITEFNKLKASHPDWDISKIILEGTKTRLRPVLMTAAVASLGFIPMALSNGAGAEVQRPLATVVIGGLISATFLTLFLLPMLYPIFHKKRKGNVFKIILPIIFLSGATSVSAQTPLNLEQATQIMLQNNRQLKFGNTTVENMKYLKKGAFDIPKTDLNVGFGQYNSNYSDLSFSIGQRFSFPTFYTNSSKVIAAEMNTLLQEQKIAQQDWVYLLRKVYFEYQLVQQKKFLLNYTDSLFTLYAKRAASRYQQGESSLMEKTTAETQQREINLQLQSIQQDEQILINQFQFLLQSDSLYLPLTAKEKMEIPRGLTISEEQVKQLPVYQRIAQQIEVNKWQLKTQKAALLPEFMFNYTNQSLSGFYTINNQDVFYGRNKRFNAFSVGVSVPLFIAPSLKRLKFNQLQINAQQMQLDAKLLETKMSLENNRLNIDKAWKQIDFYENTALKNSQILLNEANQKVQLGEIDFFQWLVMIQQALIIQNNYLDVLRNYNEQIITFKKLNNE
jgi:cobalt-zinc-cadmium resistance protein CzcA